MQEYSGGSVLNTHWNSCIAFSHKEKGIAVVKMSCDKSTDQSFGIFCVQQVEEMSNTVNKEKIYIFFYSVPQCRRDICTQEFGEIIKT